MKTIECYKTIDGQLFEDEGQAKSHEEDMIGSELDCLLMSVMEFNVGRSQVYKGIIKAMNNRKALKDTCQKILSILQYGES